MGAFRTGSYEVTPPGRSRACGTARQADRSRQGQQVRVSLTESKTQSGAKYILTVLRLLGHARSRSAGLLPARMVPSGDHRRPRAGSGHGCGEAGQDEVEDGVRGQPAGPVPGVPQVHVAQPATLNSAAADRSGSDTARRLPCAAPSRRTRHQGALCRHPAGVLARADAVRGSALPDRDRPARRQCPPRDRGPSDGDAQALWALMSNRAGRRRSGSRCVHLLQAVGTAVDTRTWTLRPAGQDR